MEFSAANLQTLNAQFVVIRKNAIQVHSFVSGPIAHHVKAIATVNIRWLGMYFCLLKASA